uniref:G-protein coupled receptors family 1 profile domain-containing protein n=1 Tax=Acrobeloides nanus TaxID=290746 RepID=A0A914E3Y1_9BILA
MIQLAIIDMIVLPCNSMITGIQAITGAHFCTSPGFYYVVGAIATCDTPLVYLILNKSLRTAFFQMLYRIFKKPTNAVSSMICKSSCTAEVNPEPQISTIQANRHSTSDQQPNVFL